MPLNALQTYGLCSNRIESLVGVTAFIGRMDGMTIELKDGWHETILEKTIEIVVENNGL